jgi:hypothetical protein
MSGAVTSAPTSAPIAAPGFLTPPTISVSTRESPRDAESYFFLDEDFLRGTFPPERRASDKPIAIACFRLVTFLPDFPLLSVPLLRSCMAFSTLSDAFLPYLAIVRPP